MRYTYIVTLPNIKDFSKCIEIIDNMLACKKIKLVRSKNTLCPNKMYKGINRVYRFNDEYNFELQFHSETSIMVKNNIHKLYNEAKMIANSTDNKDKLRYNEIIKEKIKLILLQKYLMLKISNVPPQ